VARAGIFGNGIRVRVNDNGMDADHEEFAGRLDVASSCDIYQPTTDGDVVVDADHGTAVAAILGAAANNSVCSVGIAPLVTFSSCNYLEYNNQSLVGRYDSIDISTNSFGIDGCSPGYQRRKLQRKLLERQQDDDDDYCPFRELDETQPTPCDFCNFTAADDDDISTSCERSIIHYCLQFFKQNQEGCIEFLDLLLGGNTCDYDTMPTLVQQDISRGIRRGRNGKGKSTDYFEVFD
jgi:Subtilase family